MIIQTKSFLGTITKISGMRMSGGSKFADFTAKFNVNGRDEILTRTMVVSRARVGDGVEVSQTDRGFGEFKIKETREERVRRGI